MAEHDALRKGQRAQDFTFARTLVRKALPADSLPRRLWRQYKPAEVVHRGSATVRRSDFSVMVDVEGSTAPTGLYLYGGCDAERMLDMGEHVASSLSNSLAISYAGHIASSRPDVLLQKLQGVSSDDVAEVSERLSLNDDYFRPNIFEATFDLGRLHDKPVRKDAIVLSIGSAITRTIYRHKTSGILVDPGGWWLAQSLDGAVPDKDTLKWFRKNFKSIGRVDVDDWEQQIRQVHAEITARTDAHLVVPSLLTVEPQDPTHIYAGRTMPETVRRREFALRLFKLSEELGIDVVDSDRLLKESGVHGAVDFAHMPREQLTPVMHESAGMLINRGIIKVKK